MPKRRKQGKNVVETEPKKRKSHPSDHVTRSQGHCKIQVPSSKITIKNDDTVENLQPPQFDEITTENYPNNGNWDALSDLTLQKFEEKSAKIEEFLAKQEFSKDIIVLPNLCFTSAINFDSLRGFVDGHRHNEFEFVRMVNRKETVLNILERLYQINSQYVYGVSGSGKSFLLYQLAAHLMKDQRYFVIYINNANSNLMSDIVQIVAAKLKSLGIDLAYLVNINEKTIQEELVDISKSLINVLNFIHRAECYLARKKIQFVYVIDQINNLKTHQKDQMSLIRELKLSYRCVLACSENKNPIYSDLTYIEIHHTFQNEKLLRFNDKQFQALCSLYNVRFEKSDRDQIMNCTGSIALKLNFFIEFYLDKKFASVSEAIYNYS